MKKGGTPTQRTKDKLVLRVQQGDPTAFAELHRIHRHRIFSLCLKMTHNEADAEDLTQEAFLQLFRKIKTFRGESTFSTWFYRLACNQVLMNFRRKKLPIVPLVGDPLEGEVVEKNIGYDDSRLKGACDRIAIIQAVSELPDGYRTIFLLHEVEGYEHNEIAGLLDCSIGNSKSQLHKARLKLREGISNGIRHNA
jgi:RNA polymerase sigma-70 factor, ECF subfamily